MQRRLVFVLFVPRQMAWGNLCTQVIRLFAAALAWLVVAGPARAQVSTFTPSNSGQYLDTDSNGNNHYAPDDPTQWAQSYTTGTDANGDSYVSALSNWSTPNYPDSSGIEAVIGTNCELNQPGTTTVGSLDVQAAGSLEIDAYNSGGIANHAVSLTIAGSAFINDGTTILESSDQPAAMIFTGSAAISGSGLFTLKSGYLDTTGTAAISNSSSIDGQGYISATMTNTGTITADVAGQTLQFLSSDSNVAGTNNPTFTNDGSLVSANGATLVINGITVDQNASGNIVGLAGSTVELDSATISGGVLNTSGSGAIFTRTGTSTIASLTNDGFFGIGGNSQLNATGTITDNGSIVINNNNPLPSTATLNFNGGTVTGSGEIDMHASSTSAFITGSFTQDSSHSIVGNGTFEAALTNYGTLSANVGGESIYLGPGSITNAGMLNATNGATLEIGGIPITNSGGTINADASSYVLLDSSTTITGGTLTSTGGTFTLSYGASTLTGLTNNGTWDVTTGNAGIDLDLEGNIVNNGDFDHGAGESNGNLGTTGGATLSGTGQVHLQGNNFDTVGSATLFNGGSQTIHGYGSMAVALTNDGTISGDESGKTLTLQATDPNIADTGSPTITNAGTLLATNGGLLALKNVTVNQTGAGQVIANGGSFALNGGGVLNGGTLTSQNGGYLYATNGANQLNNLTTNAPFYLYGATVTVSNVISSGTIGEDQGDLDISGTFTNNGTIEISEDSTLSASANGTLTGSGVATLDEYSDLKSTNGAVFTNAQTLTSNSAEIDADFANRGTFNATSATILSNQFDNYAAMSGVGTYGGFDFEGGNVDNHAGATMNGVLEFFNTGTVSNEGTMQSTNVYIGNAGNNTNSGTIAVNGPNGFFELSPLELPTGNYLTNTGTIALTKQAQGEFDLYQSVPWENDGTILLDSTSSLTISTLASIVFGDGSAYDVQLGNGTATGLMLLEGTSLDLDHLNSLNITMAPGAAFGGPYLIAEYIGTLSGEFNRVTDGYTVDYSTPGEILITAFVPEPTTLSLLLLGAGAILKGRRRRASA